MSVAGVVILGLLRLYANPSGTGTTASQRNRYGVMLRQNQGNGLAVNANFGGNFPVGRTFQMAFDSQRRIRCTD